MLHEEHGADCYLLFNEEPDLYRSRVKHRAIGVVYDPLREKTGNYVPSIMSKRYDALIIWIKQPHFIPSTMPAEKTKNFGKDVPLKRAGQPAELAPVYVLLASQDSSYMTGSTVQVTGGTPTI
jgi:hypothetical protein